MLTTIQRTFKNGTVVLDEVPGCLDDARVLVTFLQTPREASPIPNLTRPEVAEMRDRLAAWEADWNAPGMEAYDGYAVN